MAYRSSLLGSRTSSENSPLSKAARSWWRRLSGNSQSNLEETLPPSSTTHESLQRQPFGLVLSGGGTRTAYQIGALRALIPYIEQTSSGVSVIAGSSIGAVNGIMLGTCLRKTDLATATDEVERIWRERTFRNTFAGSPSMAFLRAIQVAMVRYRSPGPVATNKAIFDPTPLMNQVDSVLTQYRLMPDSAAGEILKAVAVMTTLEGAKRTPLLFVEGKESQTLHLFEGASYRAVHVEALTARHGFASAALPSVLPAVELDLEDQKVRLVDGGICENVPVDPTMRLGAERIIVLDASGREWWANHYGTPHDEHPSWEVRAQEQSFCLAPMESIILRNKTALGIVLRDAVKHSLKARMQALGPTWPIFKLLKQKMGEDLAYEVLTYVALDADYVAGLIDQGYNDMKQLLQRHDQQANLPQQIVA